MLVWRGRCGYNRAEKRESNIQRMDTNMNSVTRSGLILVLCGVLAFAAGCGKEQEFSAVTQILISDISVEETVCLAKEVLGGMNFAI